LATGPEAGQPKNPELRRLKQLAAGVLAYLVAWIGSMLALVAVILAGDVDGEPDFTFLSFVGGALGSAISAAISAAQRVANGWELATGDKFPETGPPDKFVAKMAPFFLLRPFLGAATGFLVYVGVVGGFLVAASEPPRPGDDLEPYGVLFLAILGGIFAKTFLERLRAAFDTLFGAGP
jgi:hypothetical protein